jgi:hypothetical protein
LEGLITKYAMSQQTLEVNLGPALKKKANKVLDVFPR